MMLDEDSADLVAKGLSQAKAPDDGQGLPQNGGDNGDF
jgi:hypothetical protein